MNSKVIFKCLSLATLIFIVGCKDEAKDGSSSSSSISVVADKSKESGCSVANVDGGAQIICGDTSAFISNGQQGVQGPSGGANGPSAKLVIGGVVPYGDEQVVGDHVISVAKDTSGKDLITVWVSAVDAVAQYENGMISPILDAVYFDSADCSGQAMAPTGKGSSLVGVMGDRLIYVDSYYKLGHEIVSCYARSKRDKDGSCAEITGPMNNFYALKAGKVNPGITTVLPPGYRIKVR